MEEVALQLRRGQESRQHWKVWAKSVADTRKSKSHSPRPRVVQKASV